MTTYYVDPSSSGEASPYDTWTKAAHALATVIAIPPAAGDIIYCRKSGGGSGETVVGVLSMASSGTNAGGWIKIIGCNASGTVDGTRYVLDANNGDFDIVDFAGYDMWWLENIEVKNNGGSAQHGFMCSAATSFGIVFINCCANDCTGSGFNGANMAGCKLHRCVSYSNTIHGFYRVSNFISFCCARDNSDSGFECNISGTYIGCISHDNTDDGFEVLNYTASAVNCAIDGNGDDGITVAAETNPYGGPIILGCRITNHSGSGDIGLNCNSEPVISGFNYFENNDGNNIQNDTLHQFIPLEGGSSTSNLEDLSNTTSGGYVDPTNHDFSTNYVDSGNPDLRRTAITIPWS